MRFANQILLFCIFIFCALSFLISCDLVKDDVDPEKELALKDDTLLVTMNVAGEINVLLNDKIGGEASLNLEQPAQGKAVLTENGTKLVYTPASDYVGLDSLTYKVCMQNKCKTAKVIFKVSKSCQTSIRTFQLDKDKQIHVGLTLNSACPVRVNTLVQAPLHGVAVIDQFSLSYTPGFNFVGWDSLMVEVACQDNRACSLYKIKFEVKDPLNCQVRSFDDHLSIWENSKNPLQVRRNDDTCGAVITSITQMPAHGTAVVDKDNFIQYAPQRNYVGTDQITYSNCTGAGNCSFATVYLTVKKEVDFDACLPKVVANPDQVTLESSNNPTRTIEIDVLANDVLCDNTFQYIEISQQGLKGSVQTVSNRIVRYVTNVNGSATDKFKYTICYTSKNLIDKVCKEAEVEVVIK